MGEKSSFSVPKNIRIIAMDLDGTLLNSDKVITPRTYRALERASEAGIAVVPATGRLVSGLPDCIKELPFVRYVIATNGASVYDRKEEKNIYSAELKVEQAAEVMAYLDQFPVLYDCYRYDRGFMTASMLDRIEDYAQTPYFVGYIRQTRKPVPELKAYLLENGGTIQKSQIFFNDSALRLEMFKEIPRHFPYLAVSSALAYNIELNHRDGNKGAALRALAQHLGVGEDGTMAFGDGINDLSMIRAASVGVAMGNSMEPVLAAADMVTGSCDEDGVAQVIEQLLE